VAATALVNFDLDNSEKAIQALDDAGLAPNVALWAKLPDYENWRLVIASDKLDQDSPLAAYGQIDSALRAASIPVHRQPSILMLPMRRPMIQELRRIFATTTDVYGMRLGGQTIGDKYLEDAFVYRIQ
jgi:hypothetical protein